MTKQHKHLAVIGHVDGNKDVHRFYRDCDSAAAVYAFAERLRADPYGGDPRPEADVYVTLVITSEAPIQISEAPFGCPHL